MLCRCVAANRSTHKLTHSLTHTFPIVFLIRTSHSVYYYIHINDIWFDNFIIVKQSKQMEKRNWKQKQKTTTTTIDLRVIECSFAENHSNRFALSNRIVFCMLYAFEVIILLSFILVLDVHSTLEWVSYAYENFTFTCKLLLLFKLYWIFIKVLMY